MARLSVGLLVGWALTNSGALPLGPPKMGPPGPQPLNPAMIQTTEKVTPVASSEGMELVDDLDAGPKPALANGMEVVMEDQAPAAPPAAAPPAPPVAMVQSSQQAAAAAGVDMIMSDAFSMKAEIQDQGEDMSMSGHMGSKYIALVDNADWNANSEVSNGYSNPPSNLGDCQKKCLQHDECVVGMWGTSGKRKGQCWLSSKKRQSSIPCLAPCLTFERRNLAKHNSPPVAATMPAQMAYKGVAYSFLAADHFSDPDKDSLTYSIQGLPPDSGITMNARTGVLSGIPSEFGAQALQPIFIQVIAEDGKGGKAQGMLRLSVAAQAS